MGGNQALLLSKKLKKREEEKRRKKRKRTKRKEKKEKKEAQHPRAELKRQQVGMGTPSLMARPCHP